MTIMITPHELSQMLASDTPPVVVDVRWVLGMPGMDPSQVGARHGDYLAGHVPGAVFLDLEHDLTGPEGETGGRHPLPDATQLTRAVQKAGITPERAVVLYDQASSMAAARVWWLLSDAGHSDVHVLEGGWAAWLAAGGDSESGEQEPHPSTWQPTLGHRGRMSADEVAAAIAAGHRAVDVRAGERYRGEIEPIDPVAGHIPGAESVPDNLLINADGTRKPPDQVRAVVGDLGEGDVLYCGSGITASHALMLLEDAGIHGAVIYPGSWSEWSRAARPVATGA